MSLQVMNQNGLLVLRPEGAMNAVTSPPLDSEMQDALSDNEAPVVLDLSLVPFISSQGLRTVVTVAKIAKARATLVVSGLQPQLLEMFKLAGLDRLVSLQDEVPLSVETSAMKAG